MSKKRPSSKKGTHRRKLRMLPAMVAAAPLAIGVPAVVSAAEAPPTGVQVPIPLPSENGGVVVGDQSHFTPIQSANGNNLKVGESITIDLDEYFQDAEGFLIYVQNPTVADVTTLSGDLYVGAKRTGTTLVNVMAYNDNQQFVDAERFRVTVDPNPLLDSDGNGFDIQDAAKAVRAMSGLSDAVKKEAARTVLRSAESFLDLPNRSPEGRAEPIERFVPERMSTVLYLDDFFGDPDGDVLNYAIDSVATFPSSSTVADYTINDNGQLEINASSYNTGSSTVTIRATDPDGLSVTQQLQVKLINLEFAPVINNIDNRETDEDTSLTFEFSIRDNDGDSVTLTAASSDQELIPDSGIQITGTGDSRTITVTPAANQHGEATIELTATDSTGLTAKKSFTVTVNPVNDAPVPYAPTVELNVPEHSTSFIKMKDFFTDPDGDTLTYSVVGSLPSSSTVAHFNFTSGTLTINSYTYNTDNSTVTIRATDPYDFSVTQQFRVTLVNRELPPAIESIGNQTMNEDTTLTVNATVRDYDGDSVTLTATSSKQELIPNSGIQITGTGDSRTITVTPAANQHGEADITLTATDSTGRTASTSFTITVDPVNDVPSISAISDKETEEDTPLSFDFTVSNPDYDLTDLAITWTSSNESLVPNANIAITGTGETRTITLTPAADAHGDATITLRATDGDGDYVEQTFDLTVTAVHDAPVLTEGATLSMEVTESVFRIFTVAELSYQGAETPEAPITFTITKLPEHGMLKINDGAVYEDGTPGTFVNGTFTLEDVENGKVLYQHDGGESATDSFEFVVSDGIAETATQTFNLSILPLNDAPLPTESPTSMFFRPGQQIVIDLDELFTDPDGDSLTYTDVSVGSNPYNASIDGHTLTLVADSMTPNSEVTIKATDPSEEWAERSLNITNLTTYTDLRDTLIGISDTYLTSYKLETVFLSSSMFTFTAESDDETIVSASVRLNDEENPVLELKGRRAGNSTVRVIGTNAYGTRVIDGFVVTVAPIEVTPIAPVPVVSNGDGDIIGTFDVTDIFTGATSYRFTYSPNSLTLSTSNTAMVEPGMWVTDTQFTVEKGYFLEPVLIEAKNAAEQIVSYVLTFDEAPEYIGNEFISDTLVVQRDNQFYFNPIFPEPLFHDENPDTLQYNVHIENEPGIASVGPAENGLFPISGINTGIITVTLSATDENGSSGYHEFTLYVVDEVLEFEGNDSSAIIDIRDFAAITDPSATIMIDNMNEIDSNAVVSIVDHEDGTFTINQLNPYPGEQAVIFRVQEGANTPITVIIYVITQETA